MKELGEFEAKGEMPRLTILRLPNDHTSGTVPGKPTPTAYVADNDLALGQVFEGLSKSKFWSQMAVFVVEDDAQNGSDHIDAHRTVAFVAGPFVKRKSVDSTLYSTTSMIRTIELCLGLDPMSQFDAFGATDVEFLHLQSRRDLVSMPARRGRSQRQEPQNGLGRGGVEKTRSGDRRPRG